jgi:hypothetical protein
MDDHERRATTLEPNATSVAGPGRRSVPQPALRRPQRATACDRCLDPPSNTVRLHSTIGYVPPVGYELRYAREGTPAAYFRLSSKWGKGQHSGSRSSVVQNTQRLLPELLILLPSTHCSSVQ